MNDFSSPDNTPSAPLSRREIRQQRRESRRELRGAGGLSWLAGLLLILLGVAFLLQNQGLISIAFNNWWALFILIPALGSFERAIQYYRSSGNRFERSTGGALLAGIILTLVALAFFFGMNWTVFGPLLIILAGLGILANTLLSGKE